LLYQQLHPGIEHSLRRANSDHCSGRTVDPSRRSLKKRIRRQQKNDGSAGGKETRWQKTSAFEDGPIYVDRLN
jgi:hypothetical protein